jgi:preprotein translocase subunit SecA
MIVPLNFYIILVISQKYIMFGLLKKIFGTAQSRKLKKYNKIVTKINVIEKLLQGLTDEEFSHKTQELQERLKNGETVDDILPDAYAVVKNGCRRLCGTDIHVSGYDQKWDMIPYDVQLLGAIAMHFGSISEMQTGEGKTLTASLPLYLNALTGKPVHLVTVNDYLAKRDCEWIGTIFRKLGLNVKSLTNDIPVHDRKDVYLADIVYGTASEFGFDYLRDNSMATSKEEQCQRGHYFAIIDEIDSILIDEARTPLIISGPSPVSRQMYDKLKAGVDQLVRMQREFCNRQSSEARKVLDTLGYFNKDEILPKLSKEEEELSLSAFERLWLVGKGTPRNKVLKRVRENPDLRAKIDDRETYFCSEQNKAEKSKILSDLFIIIDERSNEYELTDKGIQAWCDFNSSGSANDFVMLDLGYEYDKVDKDKDLSDQEKIQKKVELREEDGIRKERSHNLRQLFRAHLLMEKNVDYIIQDEKIVIIDENTGRPQPGRRFSDGLHQSIEAKESLAIQKETQTFATITLQNYFRMYDKIGGMTGTAITEATEFKEIYSLEVLEIPTYCKCERVDSDDEIYMTEREKYVALLKEIKKIHEEHRPILIGTESVEISEKLSRILKQNHLNHTVLNAKNHTKEAEIIANAGRKGAITLATNMAGRGTDIKLSKEVHHLGGLHVIGTTRHNSRRIDRQLRGRSGRLGDPGSSKFFISFEDSLMRLFASPRLTAMLQKFRPPEGEPISAKVLNKSIETAQKRIEQRNYTIRKHTLEYDDVMNKQRQEIYSFRNELLHTNDSKSISIDVIENICSSKAHEYFTNRDNAGNWPHEELRKFLMTTFPVFFTEDSFNYEHAKLEDIEQIIIDKILEAFEQKLSYQKQLIEQLTPSGSDSKKLSNLLNEVINNLMLRKIDQLWQEHLLSIDHVRSDVHLRVIGQKDPLLEFKHEAFLLFNNFSNELKLEISKDLFRFEMISPKRREEIEKTISKLQMHKNKSFVPQPGREISSTQMNKPQNMPPSSAPEDINDSSKTISPNNEIKVGRNDLCPCGSGKKYKKCCGSGILKT